MTRYLFMTLGVTALLSTASFSPAAFSENSQNFMQLHQVEISLHEAGSTKDLEKMLSLFTDNAVLTAGDKIYTGKEQVKRYWQTAGPFQPKNHWVGYTPAFRIRYQVQGDRAHLYFECLWVDRTTGKIAAHTNSDDELVRANGRWLIKRMKATVVPGL